MKSQKEEYIRFLHEQAKSTNTISTYKQVLDFFEIWLSESGLDITGLKPVDIHTYINFLRNQKNYSHNTVMKHVGTLKSFFGYLAQEGMISSLPTQRIEIEKRAALTTDRNRWFSRKEQDQFIAYVKSNNSDFHRTRDLAIIDLMLRAGMRVSEVANLRLNGIIEESNRNFILNFIGKGGHYEHVHLIQEYSKSFRAWMSMRKQLEKEIHQSSPYVFVSERSGHFGRISIAQMLNKYAKIAQMEHVSPHRFRHSFCKNLANDGVRPEIIRKLARHKRMETTMIYIESSLDEELEALKKTVR